MSHKLIINSFDQPPADQPPISEQEMGEIFESLSNHQKWEREGYMYRLLEVSYYDKRIHSPVCQYYPLGQNCVGRLVFPKSIPHVHDPFSVKFYFFKESKEKVLISLQDFIFSDRDYYQPTPKEYLQKGITIKKGWWFNRRVGKANLFTILKIPYFDSQNWELEFCYSEPSSWKYKRFKHSK